MRFRTCPQRLHCGPSSPRFVHSVARDDVPAQREEAIIYHFRQALPAGTRARYVKVRATNAGPLPGWHPGAGGKAWTVADELVVR